MCSGNRTCGKNGALGNGNNGARPENEASASGGPDDDIEKSIRSERRSERRPFKGVTVCHDAILSDDLAAHIMSRSVDARFSPSGSLVQSPVPITTTCRFSETFMPRATGVISTNPHQESAADRKKRALKIVKSLAKAYPDAECALKHNSPFQLLAATILSAQCTDERVNMVTPELFRKYPTAANLANAKLGDVEKIIQSCGFFRAKAKSLTGMAKGLVEKCDGEVPRDLDTLVDLPGVGRKTANVVLGTAYGLPTGVVVDTHVRRVSNRLGLTTSSNPEIIERDLQALLPPKEWIMYSHRLIWHGRKVCFARKPNCPGCPLLKLCPRVGVEDGR